jgi:hypothetical protein
MSFSQNNNEVSYVKGRVYPSSDVPYILSKKEGKRPRFTRAELIDRAQKFHNLSPQDRPRLRYNHSTNPRDEIGMVKNLWFNDSDGWLWMEAAIYHHHRNNASQFLRNGIFRKGISLTFSVKNQYKDFVEISLVPNPDFEGAFVEEFHNLEFPDLFVLPLRTAQFALPPPPPFSFMAAPQPQAPQGQPPAAPSGQQQQPQQQPTNELDKYYQRIDSGHWVVYDASKVPAIQQLALSRGVDPRMVIHQDISSLSGMPAEAQQAIIAGLLAQNQIATQRLQQEEMAKQQQTIQATLGEIKPIVDYASSFVPEGPDRAAIAQQMAVSMAVDPKLRAMGDILGQAMQSTKALQEENQRLKMGQMTSFQSGTQFSPVTLPSMQSQLNNAMYGQGYPSAYPQQQQQQQPQQSYGYPQTQQPVLYAHSGPQYGQPMTSPFSGAPTPAIYQPTTSFSGVPVPAIQTQATMTNYMAQLTQAWQAQQTGSSSSSTPAIFSHSADRPDAKRQRNPVLDSYVDGDFKLFPQTAGGDASQPSASATDVMIFSHSGPSPAVDQRKRRCLHGSPVEYVPPGGYLGTLKQTSTDQDIIGANLCAIISGERNIGKVPRDFLTENLFSRLPKVFTGIASGLVDGELIDNKAAGIGGHAQPSKLPIIERIRNRGYESKYFRTFADFGTA